ncbi:MAG TPA: M1 family metallopeptidase [Gemmatimonadaceae bacterium]|nr:M1 family metallopeptidase [Gemmatimonadaceae bacterium]
MPGRTVRARLTPVAASLTLLGAPLYAQAARVPERAVRRDIPITNAIRRAYAAGSRDSTGRPSRSYWQMRTDYTIQASLDVASSRLTGRETVVLHNNSPDSLAQIVLRLDPNIFLGNTPQSATWVPSEVTDGMILTRMTVNGVPVMLAPAAGASGDGARAAQAAAAAQNAQVPNQPTLINGKTTLARVQLPTKIPPRSQTTLEIEWNHKIPGGPGVGHRMTQRWADTLYQPTQWYPRVAVYDDLRGWDPELYLGPSEFYNNFGKFDVSIDVPAGWIVSGTGTLQNPEEVLTPNARERLKGVLATNDITTIVGPDEVGPGQATQRGTNDRLVWHFTADTVNDFAWATAKKFVWSATRATIPGKGPVPINLLYLPGRANLFDTAGQIARHALEFYSKQWFPYQFPQLTLQDGPSAGMEYPMVINSNKGAADHETGHQWWPMVVSNNETWYGWMDEGFNQYMNILSDADAADARPVLDVLGQSYGRTSGSEAEPPMMWNANYAGPGFYGFTTYSKTPLMLSALGGIVGDSAVQRAHREWGTAWMFKHPSPWDYMFFMSKALKQDLGWFWYYWLFTTESVDGSIAKSTTTTGGRTTVTVRQDGQMPSPVVLEVKFASGSQPIRPMRNAVMKDAQTAVVTFPVDVWFTGNRTFDAVLDLGARPIEQIKLDPGCRFPDRDPSDNVWPRKPAAAPAPAPAQGGGRRQNTCE